MLFLTTPIDKYGLRGADKVGKGVTPNRHIWGFTGLPESFVLDILELVLAILEIGSFLLLGGSVYKRQDWSIDLLTRLFIHLPIIHTSTCIYINLSTHPSVYLAICASPHLCIYTRNCISACLLSICLSICLSIYLSISLSVCLSIYLIINRTCSFLYHVCLSTSIVLLSPLVFLHFFRYFIVFM